MGSNSNASATVVFVFVYALLSFQRSTYAQHYTCTFVLVGDDGRCRNNTHSSAHERYDGLGKNTRAEGKGGWGLCIRRYVVSLVVAAVNISVKYI